MSISIDIWFYRMTDLSKFLDESTCLLDRRSYVPLYRQIKHKLVRQIAYWNGADLKFYSDDELCERFKVSRMTVRQAVKELVDEGYLARERGVGTFLNKEKVLERPVTRSGERLSFAGSPFKLIVKRFEHIPTPAPVAVELGIEPDAIALHVVRVRRARGIAVSLDERWLSAEAAEGLEPSCVSSGSLVQWLGARYALVGADMQFEGSVATKAAAEQLSIAVGDPVLVRYMTYRDTSGTARMTGHSIHRSDVMRYSVSVQIGE